MNTTGSDNSSPLDISITFIGNCQLEKVCGMLQVEIPGTSPCTTDVIIESVSGNRFMFRSENLSPTCGTPYTQYLELQDDNTALNYDSKGDYGETRGKLIRVP